MAKAVTASQRGYDNSVDTVLDEERAATLPMTMAGQNMIGLVNRRACAYRVIKKLQAECSQQKHRSRYEGDLFSADRRT